MVFIVLRKQPYLFLYLMACVLWTVCISLPLSVYVRLSRYELKSVSDKTLWEEASSGNMIQHKRISLSHSVILAGEDWETSQIPCGPLKSLSSLPLPFPSLSHSLVVTLTPTLSSLKKTRFFNSPAEWLLNALMYDRERKRVRDGQPEGWRNRKIKSR